MTTDKLPMNPPSTAPGERRGMAYLPAVHRAWWTPGLAVNYIASFGKPGHAAA